MADPSEIAVFPTERFGVAQPRGTVRGARIVTLARALSSHADWRPGFTEVWDMRFASEIDLVPSDIPAMMAIEQETKDALAGSTTLVIVPRPLILFSVQFYARLVKPLGRIVVGVETEQQATEILGVDALPVLPGPDAGEPGE